MEVNIRDNYSVRRFQNSDADEVSNLIINTLRMTNIKDYSVKNGIDVVDEEQLFRLEKFR